MKPEDRKVFYLGNPGASEAQPGGGDTTRPLNSEGVEFIYSSMAIFIKKQLLQEHIHILSDLHPSVALADYIKDIKVSSSKWMKASGYFPDFKGWAVKYCALTYSNKEKEVIIRYIKNQQEHHKKESFVDEVRRLFKENGIDLDEKWFWQDE
ncbi:hypothetical protein EZS27_016855 [termite gut metagenome]|uniref:Transposase IS200-like domain-containing protein n=1 Tax=termite gut metagenome TaxID=433724 RepID=A0A5J4RN89_9ZZZZ